MLTKVLIPILVFISIILLYLFFSTLDCQAFSIQAQSFLHGRLDIPHRIDAVYKDGRYYWPQGPFPSIILMPFQIIFGSGFNQTIMHPILIIVTAIFLYKLARLKSFDISSSIFLTYAFLFASQTIGSLIQPCYSHFAHILSILLLTITLFEFESRKRPLILGFLIAAIIATRPTAAFIFIPILYYFLKSKEFHKVKQFTVFIVPIILSITLLSLFNQIRFQNPLDNGYSTNNVGENLENLRNKGVFSPVHMPYNFYYFFLAPLHPVVQNNSHLVFPFLAYHAAGLSFFIVSPFFIYAFRSLRINSRRIKSYWFVVFLTLLVLLNYYSAGWVQFGPRFLSDIMPILYLLLLYSFRIPRLSEKQILFILLSSLLNTYLLLSNTLLLLWQVFRK